MAIDGGETDGPGDVAPCLLIHISSKENRGLLKVYFLPHGGSISTYNIDDLLGLLHGGFPENNCIIYKQTVRERWSLSLEFYTIKAFLTNSFFNHD